MQDKYEIADMLRNAGSNNVKVGEDHDCVMCVCPITRSRGIVSFLIDGGEWDWHCAIKCRRNCMLNPNQFSGIEGFLRGVQKNRLIVARGLESIDMFVGKWEFEKKQAAKASKDEKKLENDPA